MSPYSIRWSYLWNFYCSFCSIFIFTSFDKIYW